MVRLLAIRLAASMALLSVGLLCASTAAALDVPIVFGAPATDSHGTAIVEGTYPSPYGRPMRVSVLMPAEHSAPLPWVWRFAPSFWSGGPGCQPFGSGQVTRYRFVYICVSIDNIVGAAGDHAHGDTVSVAQALRLAPAVQAIVGSDPAQELVVGSSASAIDGVVAVAASPGRFARAAFFDMPADLVARYWQLAPSDKRRTAPEYGGAPTGRRAARYLQRSPLARTAQLARSATRISWLMSRNDPAACAPAQWPTFIPQLARAARRPLEVVVGGWHHGTGWTEQEGLLVAGLGLAPEVPADSTLTLLRVGSRGGAALRCAP